MCYEEKVFVSRLGKKKGGNAYKPTFTILEGFLIKVKYCAFIDFFHSKLYYKFEEIRYYCITMKKGLGSAF